MYTLAPLRANKEGSRPRRQKEPCTKEGRLPKEAQGAPGSSPGPARGDERVGGDGDRSVVVQSP